MSDDEAEEEEKWDEQRLESMESPGPLAFPPPPCVLHPRAGAGGCSCGDDDHSRMGLFSLFRKGFGYVRVVACGSSLPSRAGLGPARVWGLG